MKTSLRTFCFVFTALSLCTAATRAQPPNATEPLRPTSLLNWLKIIDSAEFRLLFAVDQNGYYFAVKVDADGDVLFCNYEHSKDSLTSSRSFTLTDVEGRDVLVFGAEKKSPVSVSIKYERSTTLGPLTQSSSATILYPAGTIHVLRDRNLTEVRVRYTEHLRDKTKIVVFDQIVQLKEFR